MRVVADSLRGHIALVRDSETVVTWTDLGPVLQIWQTGSNVEMTPDDARALAAALGAWANKKSPLLIEATDEWPDAIYDPVENAVFAAMQTATPGRATHVEVTYAALNAVRALIAESTVQARTDAKRAQETA